MDKRGQFFIVGAIILALVLFILMTVVNTYREENLLEDFPDLTNNYKIESVKVINDALLNDQEPKEKLDTFTGKYIDYAKTIDPNIGLIYIYREKKEIGVPAVSHVKNYLNDETVTIYTRGQGITEGADDLFSDSQNSLNDISIDVDGFQFKKTVPIKVCNYGESYCSGNFPGGGALYAEIAGIFYPIKLYQNFQVITKSESTVNPNVVRVGIS